MKSHLKVLALFLSVVCALGAFSACGALQKPTDAEMRAEIEKLLPSAYKAACILYGEGLPPDESFEIDPTWTIAHYAPVSENAEYRGPEEVWKLFITTFSKSMALEMFEAAFEGTEDMRPRYGTDKGKYTRAQALAVYKYLTGESREAPEPFEGKLTVNVSTGMLYEPKAVFYTETVRVLKGTSAACYVEIEYSVDGAARMKATLKMVKEHGKWLFDENVY